MWKGIKTPGVACGIPASGLHSVLTTGVTWKDVRNLKCGEKDEIDSRVDIGITRALIQREEKLGSYTMWCDVMWWAKHLFDSSIQVYECYTIRNVFDSRFESMASSDNVSSHYWRVRLNNFRTPASDIHITLNLPCINHDTPELKCTSRTNTTN